MFGKLLTRMYAKIFWVAILDYTFSTNGILLDFYYVILYTIFIYSEKKWACYEFI